MDKNKKPNTNIAANQSKPTPVMAEFMKMHKTPEYKAKEEARQIRKEALLEMGYTIDEIADELLVL